MSNIAIQVQGLGKRYRIGRSTQRHDSLRDAITHAATAPFRNLRQLRRLSRFGEEGAADDVVWALRDASFEIRVGETVGIIGRNGAGKSTLLKILSRITEPTAGRVKVYGRVGALLEVGTGFHPELTGRENVFLNGSILGMDKSHIRSKFDEIVEFAGVGAFIDTPVKRYSSGMYLRLAFAVAAHLEPEILVVDEVLAVGDMEFQSKCLGKMQDVAGEGRTVLFVSHNMGAVTNLCRRGIFLQSGTVAADGPMPVVVRTYMSSVRPQGTIDLETYEPRKGKGSALFTAIRYEDQAGNPVQSGVSGRPLVVVLSYRSTAPLRNSRVSLAFYDSVGQLLFNCSSELTHRGVLNLPSEGEIRCTIPRLPLSQSGYVVEPFLEVSGEIEDWIEGAISLPVVDGDFFGSGRQYPDGWEGRGVLVSHDWAFDG
jgi:lipopolysaccharide transport system ATP-binding protein